MIGTGRYLPASIAALAILGVSCVKATYTQSVRDRFGLSAQDLGRLQFFTSQEIVLQREVSLQNKERRGAELAIQDGVRIEQVVIPGGTPCVAIEVEPDLSLVSFARQSPGHALWFGSAFGTAAGSASGTTSASASGPTLVSDDTLSPDSRPFSLVALENQPGEPAPFVPRPSKGFLVTWGGQKYRIASGRGAYLTYELDESFAREKVKQEPPGWRLSEGVPSVATPAAASSTALVPAPPGSASAAPAPAPPP